MRVGWGFVRRTGEELLFFRGDLLREFGFADGFRLQRSKRAEVVGIDGFLPRCCISSDTHGGVETGLAGGLQSLGQAWGEYRGHLTALERLPFLGDGGDD